MTQEEMDEVIKLLSKNAEPIVQIDPCVKCVWLRMVDDNTGYCFVVSCEEHKRCKKNKKNRG